MRTMLFMSRMAGMVFLMIGVLLGVFVLLDIVRAGQHARGLLIGTDLWHQGRAMISALF